ncbi:patatin-like protein [Mycobacterium sp. TY814]|uniref:patatin-like protein n=1 Tax=unclassified Mycobacterium TaxID=2642494 RepID=UPI002741A292|nr:patatin-like protein [Mycobacterium sp. TY814]MDP7726521.1 patatin-like protein [Mycobacterium sp. TY814]
MTFETPSPVTELTQELRLATTMTGGVSLAIWMAGVTREINLLAQASQWRREGGPFPADNRLSKESTASLRLYASLIDLLDVIVDVDVLSGTSAGGINAALLASSRVSGSDLGGLRELWLDLGALTDLLRDPRDKYTPSLLYGDERMFAALAKQIPKLAPGPFPPAEFPGGARTPSTTLYVTTTLLTGEASRFTDSFGTLVQDVDRRGLFTFTETDLVRPDTVGALALAARSSASFPIAFEPSFLPFNKGTPAKGKVPARPPMAAFSNITRPHWAADGGLLDNRPIDVLLKRIFDRPARRPVRRVLLFVVPSAGPAPDLVAEPAPDDVDRPLGLIDGLLKDLAAITTQSIAADLRAIRAHQDRMEARTDTKLRLAELAAAMPHPSRLLTAALLNDYATREATRLAQMLTDALLRQLGTWPPAPATMRNAERSEEERRHQAAPSRLAESIPPNWEPELAVGGDSDRACRHRISGAIMSRWALPPEQTLPHGPADLARYGQPAYDLAKSCALAVVLAAYEVARSDTDVAALADLTRGIHAAWPPPAPVDLGAVVHSVCTNATVRQGSLTNAAALIAADYLQQITVPPVGWSNLGRVLFDSFGMLTSLASNGSVTADAAGPLRTYLGYLDQATDAETMALALFDLAATQRAMLPAEADIEQSVELVQVSADSRNLLAPDWQTAQQKLTGMQFHHFGAFYKRSWRANDWMWGRLDGAGWLVHALLDPRRVRWMVDHRAAPSDRAGNTDSGAQWFLDRLKELGAPDFPKSGYRLPTVGEQSERLTEDMVLAELSFLDDASAAVPPSLPRTSLWLAQAWQQRVLDEELDDLAATVIDTEPGERPDWSPATSRTWAKKVLAAHSGPAKYALLNEDPVAAETFASDRNSPLMAHTLSKAAATTSGAAGSIRQLPGVVKPPLATLKTVALGAYRVVSLTRGVARWTLLSGTALLVLGVAAAVASADTFGALGLVAAGIGGYLVVLATWQFSGRLLFALLSTTLVGAVLSLATPVVRRWLFGDVKHPGWVGAHVYWLGAQWWHPLAVVAAIALALTLVAVARPSSTPARRRPDRGRPPRVRKPHRGDVTSGR